MKAVEFNGHNVVYAKDQPEYLPLPAHRSKEGEVTTCWELSFLERLKVLWTGRVYLTQLTFNEPLQPVRMSVTNEVEPSEIELSKDDK